MRLLVVGAILLTCANLGAGPSQAVVPRVHVLLVADGKDPVLAQHWGAGCDNLRRVLEEGFATRPHRLVLTVLDKAGASADGILEHYRMLSGKVKPEDTLFFHYSGAASGSSPGRVLLPHHPQPLAVKDLRQAMLKLNARQAIVFADCWQVPKLEEPQLKGLTTAALGDNLFSVPAKAEWPVLDALFFHHKGLSEIHTRQHDPRWLLTDAKDRPQGSMPTAAFITLICRKLGAFQTGLVTWPAFSVDWKRETERLFQARRKFFLSKAPLGDYAKSSEGWLNIVSLAETAPQKIVEKTWLFGAEFAEARLNDRPVVILVKVYPKTPAAKAGFADNDVVLAVDGRAVATTEDLVRAIEYSEGRIEVDYRRAGQNKKQAVQLTPVKQAK